MNVAVLWTSQHAHLTCPSYHKLVPGLCPYFFFSNMMVSPDPPSFRVLALLRLNTPTVSEVARAAIIEQFLQTVIGLWLNGRSDVEAHVHLS